MPGLPKSYITKYGITKKAWREYRASKKGGKSKAKKSRATKPKGGKRKVGRRSFLSPSTLFKFIRIGALAAPAVARYKRFGVAEALKGFSGVGTDNKFRWATLAEMWVPYLATCLVTHGIGKLNGIIRRL